MKRRLLAAFLLPALLAASPTPGAAQSAPPEDPVRLYRLGAESAARGDYYRALEHFRRALDRNPVYADALLACGEIYFLLEEFDQALPLADRALALSPGNAAAGILRGRILAGLGDYPAAEAAFRTALEREPHNVEGRLAKAELDILRGKNAAAAAEILETLNAAPNNRRALLSLAVLYQNTGNPAEARRYFELALRHHGEVVETQVLAGEFYLREGRLREAQRCAEAALSIQEDHEGALILLGSVHLARKDYQAVYGLMDRVLRRNRQNSSAWYLKSMSSLRLGRPEETIRLLGSLLALRPEDEIARITLEDTLREHFPMEDPLRKTYAAYHFQRGDRFQERNLFSRAMEEYRRGLQVDPYSKPGRIAFSDILSRLGFRGRSLNALAFLRNQNLSDPEVEEKIELAESLLEDRVSRTWGMDDSVPAKGGFAVSVFTDSASGTSLHQDSEIYLARYLADLLVGSPRFSLITDPQKVQHYGAAFQESRQRGGEYFIILSFQETEREFSVSADLYLSRTGGRIDSIRIRRGGNDRIQGALTRLAADLAERFPPRGRLLGRNFDKGLANLGRVDGIAEGDLLLILPSREVALKHDELRFTFDPQEVLGTLRITKIDDTMSEGVIERRGFFDRINPGDALIPGKAPEPEKEKAEDGAAPPLYKRILRIR